MLTASSNPRERIRLLYKIVETTLRIDGSLDYDVMVHSYRR